MKNTKISWLVILITLQVWATEEVYDDYQLSNNDEAIYGDETKFDERENDSEDQSPNNELEDALEEAIEPNQISLERLKEQLETYEIYEGYQDLYELEENVDLDENPANKIPELANSQNKTGDEEGFLEGISVVGKIKIAYLSIKGHQISVKEGEKFTLKQENTISIWRVIQIKKESVILKAEGYDLEKELRLHSRLPSSTYQTLPAKATAISPETINSDPHEESSLYRLIRTPFGNFVIKDDASVPQLPVSQPSQAQEKPIVADPEEEILQESRVMQTPFGTLIVKDKE